MNDIELNSQDSGRSPDLLCRSDASLFDADWYRTRYADVDMLNADPLQHFLTWGRLLERSPGPNFDTCFYLSRYGDVGTQNPLLHYQSLPENDNRPLSPAQLKDDLNALTERMNAQWQPIPPSSPRAVPPTISYCIPLMGRLDDIRGTLAENLATHAELTDRVEFVIVLFGDSAESEDFIRTNFPDALNSRLLRVICDDSLDSWHFGKAKNAFRPHILGRIYSSLDADNFVTRDETLRLLAMDSQFDGHFLLHHFSGQWGDGTSGRVSMPAAVYRSIGYDSSLLPRQFDEMDLILRALQRFPAMPFLCIDASQNIFVKSTFACKFRNDERLPNRIISIGDYPRRAPLNPRGEGYAQQTPYINHMGNLNAGLSGFGASSNPDRSRAYLEKLTVDKHRLLDTMPRDILLSTFFHSLRDEDTDWRILPGQICAFLVVKNEAHFLPPLLAHYRRRGVSQFFIVDDGSAHPVEEWMTDADVHVFHPKVGSFRTLKTAWVEALMNYFLPPGSWALTIDADEFVHLPADTPSFTVLAARLEQQGRDFMPGLMIDLLPAPGTAFEVLQYAERDFLQLFTHCGNADEPVPESYSKHASIAWAFGPHARLAWLVDVRNHAFGTFDSLRKIPFLRWQPGRHLNQGFHTLHYTDGRSQPGHEIWESEILPVYHYKLVRLFSEQTRAQMLREAGNYHDRTKENLTRIFGGDGSVALAKLRELEPATMPIENLSARMALLQNLGDGGFPSGILGVKRVA
ncbi:glycosyltransferase family 2 protein [Cereibacter sphaeroides]|uniref:glycosyltransferase family 2 protein n=1 Tax=Cereibacter sphaeroides TaxID=1063 RepID=UPI001F374CDC|nr:glycosyltransferase family 2 protein [Cereibacter sphaeroides]MCE6967244.1 glycosyltransferase family 2 protein [Cereibacter sphaeroides]